ncbi:MAG: phenylalanine--tRNA ligase beta subunit-related protein [Planctomycetota bacterium]
MSSPALGGDLVLAARPVTPEAFAPYGRMVAAGDRVKLGNKAASVLVALDPREVGPRRVLTLQRFVGAKRLLVPLAADGFLLVVAGAGDPPAGPAAAYLVRGGTGVVLDAGVWHAGPYPLTDGTVLEAVEVTGPADHVDRCSVLDAFGAEGLRLMTSDEEGAPGTGLDLADDLAITLAEGLRGRLALGCLAFDGLTVGDADDALREEGDRLEAALRAQWGGETSPSEIPALKPVRDLYRALGLDPTKTRPASEALLRRVLQGRPLYRVNSLVDAMNLCSLTTLVPFGVYDRARIVAPVMLRFGSVGEGYEGIGRGRVGVEGKPVLVDRDGPFGNPTADSLRTSVGHGTTKALVVLYLPPTVDAAHVDRFLGAASAAVVRACGGAETGRRVVR